MSSKPRRSASKYRRISKPARQTQTIKKILDTDKIDFNILKEASESGQLGKGWVNIAVDSIR